MKIEISKGIETPVTKFFCSSPETDAFFLKRGVWSDEILAFCRKLERERDEAREENAKLRDIAERAINYLDQSYRDGFSDEASDLRYELAQLKEETK